MSRGAGGIWHGLRLSCRCKMGCQQSSMRADRWCNRSKSAFGGIVAFNAKLTADVAAHIASTHGLGVVVTGMASADAVCRLIAGAAGGRGVCDAGLTDVGGLIRLIAGSRLLVGGDSGGGHLAAALGVATVSVFGATSPARWRPLGKRVRILGGAMEDVRMGRVEATERNRGILASISAASVIEAVDAALADGGNGSGD